MTCPKDANYTPGIIMCREPSECLCYVCTRKKGHKGEHHAHGDSGHCCAVW